MKTGAWLLRTTLLIGIFSAVPVFAASPRYYKAYDLSNGKIFYCAKVSGAWQSFTRKGRRYISDQSSRRIGKASLKARTRACPGAAKGPIASDITASGQGTNPIELDLPVDARKSKSRLQCFIEVTPDVTYQVNGCSVTATPAIEALGAISVRYYAVRDGRNRSNTATLSLSWSRFPAPLVSSASFQGSGLSPVAVQMEVQSGKPQSAAECIIDSIPDGVTVQTFPNCTALVTPGNHRIGQAVISYHAVRRDSDIAVRSSNDGVITVTWDQSAEFSGDENSTALYRSSLTEPEARYLARWADFGGFSDQIAELAASPGGLDAAVDFITSPAQTACPQVKEAAINLARASRTTRLCQSVSYYTTHQESNGSFRRITRDYCAPNDATGKIVWGTASVTNYWLKMMLESCQPLQERMGLLYHNHFDSDILRFAGSSTQDHYMMQHIDLLRSDVPSNTGLLMPFSYIASQMDGADGSMLTYLNNDANIFGAGNENYAREKLELFLMGITDPGTGATNYDEADIYELSYSLAGYTQQTLLYDDPRVRQPYLMESDVQTMCCNPSEWINPDTGLPYHIRNSDGSDGGEACPAASPRCTARSVRVPAFDIYRWDPNPNRPRSKHIFAGKDYAIEGPFKADSITPDDTLTPALMQAAPIARYVAARLLGNFASANLSNDAITDVAAAIQNSDFDLIPALRKIFSSSMFFSAATRYDSVTNPIETLISFLRITGLPVVRGSARDLYATIRSILLDSGMELGRPPSVFGQPEAGKMTGGRMHDGHFFLQTQLLLGRLTGIPRIVTDLEYLRRFEAASVPGFSWEALVPVGVNRRNPEEVLDYFAGKLAIELDAQERDLILEYLRNASMKTINEADTRIASPDPAFMQAISWSSLPEAEFQKFFRMKITGLLELLNATVRGHTK